jgi:hypothetical protein
MSCGNEPCRRLLPSPCSERPQDLPAFGSFALQALLHPRSFLDRVLLHIWSFLNRVLLHPWSVLDGALLRYGDVGLKVYGL